MMRDKYVKVDIRHPSAKAVCDYSGFNFNRKDLVEQMEWRGNNKVYTGFLVGRPFVDKPQPQLRPPPIKPDPIAIPTPRPPTPYTSPDSNPVPPWPELLRQLNTFHWGS